MFWNNPQIIYARHIHVIAQNKKVRVVITCNSLNEGIIGSICNPVTNGTAFAFKFVFIFANGAIEIGNSTVIRKMKNFMVSATRAVNIVLRPRFSKNANNL